MRLSLAFRFIANIGLISQCFSEQVRSKAASQAIEDAAHMTFLNGQFTARINNRPLQSVAEEIAAVTKVNVLVAEHIGDNRASLHVENVTIAEALHTLLVDYDTFFFYGNVKGAPAVLRTVWVYPKGTASVLQPVPPEAWASSKELEIALSDSDPQARELTYNALMSRPDPRSRSLVIEALKGTRERDDRLRQGLLLTLMSKGFPIPSLVLADLVRADASAEIRSMALDAILDHPSAKQVAEAALFDANQAVRDKAKEILMQFNAAQRPSAAAPASDDRP
jgi:hypothetical protein